MAQDSGQICVTHVPKAALAVLAPEALQLALTSHAGDVTAARSFASRSIGPATLAITGEDGRSESDQPSLPCLPPCQHLAFRQNERKFRVFARVP